MRPRARTATPVNAEKRPKTSRPSELHAPHRFVAPVRGLVLNENIAAVQPGSASVMENWFPTVTGIRPRAGTTKHATTGSLPVVSMWAYEIGSTKKLFAATETSIFEVFNPADPDVAPLADVTGQTAGYYATTAFQTAGGNFLYAVNGADEALLYDGTAWAAIDGTSTPAITGVTTSTLSHVWSFASRLWFVQKGTMNAWYLPVDSIGGAAAQFSLAGIFAKGGELLFGARWSLDAGDGLDDKCVFVSSLGEVAVYEGTNPGSATDWRKVGVYDITKPLGFKAVMQAGGDLLIATVTGIIPMSEMVNKDPAALAGGAVTRAIEPLWRELVLDRSGAKFELTKWPERSMMLVTVARNSAADEILTYAANLQTGAWGGPFTGWDAQCAAYVDGQVYVGTVDGRILAVDRGGSDDGDLYVCTYVGQFEDMGTPDVQKTIHQARSIYRSSTNFAARTSCSTNYDVTLPAPPDVITDIGTGVWDVSLWDVGKWGSDTKYSITAKWTSIGKTGYVVAPQVQLTSGATEAIDAELVATTVTYTKGAVVT